MVFSGSGAGTSGDPYQITNWEQLQEVNDELDAYYILMNDLDENTSDYSTYASDTANAGAGWVPIGDDSTPFLGSFDGQNFTISDLFINRPTTERQGLFGQVGTLDSSSTGTIKNITLSNFDITTGQVGGCLAGAIRDRNAEKVVLVENVHVIDSSIIFSIHIFEDFLVFLGGLIGLSECKVISCSAINTVVNANNTATTRDVRVVGGLIGGVQGGLVEKCFAKGCSVYADFEYGGLVGRLLSTDDVGDVTVRNCFSDCTLFDSISSGSNNGVCGGFTGSMIHGTGSTMLVDKCYSLSDISNASDGSLFNRNVFLNRGTLIRTNNFSLDDGVSISPGATIKTESEMKDRDTFTDTTTDGLDEAWDMAETNTYDDTKIWGIGLNGFDNTNDGYPYLTSLVTESIPITTFPATNISLTTVTLNGEVEYLE